MRDEGRMGVCGESETGTRIGLRLNAAVCFRVSLTRLQGQGIRHRYLLRATDEGSQDAPAHSVPRVASPPGRAPLKSKTRWAACGKCVACTRSDCGDCINCADKAKFGGSGVRKQSCVRRRCLRMNANNAAARHQPSNRGRPDAQPERRGQDVAFWDAVAGCAARRHPAPPTCRRPSACAS